MYADKQRRSVKEHVDVFVRAAKEALDRDDVVSAATTTASPCSAPTIPPCGLPSRRPTRRRASASARRASRARARRRRRAAGGRPRTKYAKAHSVHAEAWIAERAANAMRLDGNDLRRAAQLAEQAVLAEPHNATYRVTLGEVYLDAGLVSRASGEAGRALAIDPDDLRANALSKRVAKGKPRASPRRALSLLAAALRLRRRRLCFASAFSSSDFVFAGPGLPAALIDRDSSSARSMTCAPVAAPAAGAPPRGPPCRARPRRPRPSPRPRRAPRSGTRRGAWPDRTGPTSSSTRWSASCFSRSLGALLLGRGELVAGHELFGEAHHVEREEPARGAAAARGACACGSSPSRAPPSSSPSSTERRRS